MSVILAQMSGNNVVNALIWIVVAGVIFWLLNWLIAYVGIPEPFNKVAKVVIAVVAVVLLINALLSIAGHPVFTWR